MSTDFSAYGNAPAGEHSAIFRQVTTERYPKGSRDIAHFLIVTSDGTEPVCGSDGNPYFAAAVCNQTKRDNPKSKQFKIRRAMLRADEYDPIENACSVPAWEHFQERARSGDRRVIGIRVAVERRESGLPLSLVTAIKRPRDGEWESIEGRFEGPPFPWLRMDGTLKPMTEAEVQQLSADQRLMRDTWSMALPVSGKPWFDQRGCFCVLEPERVQGLSQFDRTLYEITRAKVTLGVF